MSVEESIIRYCIAVDNTIAIKESISLKVEEEDEHRLSEEYGINNVQAFVSEAVLFLIFDMNRFNNTAIFKRDTLWQHIGLVNMMPLRCIFKKPLLDSGSQKLRDDFKRTVMTLTLENSPELIREYIAIHQNVWPQIIVNMNTMGIRAMEIYLHGYQAFLIMDTPLDFDMDKDGEQWSKLPQEKEWQAYVGKFQKVDPESKATEKWKQFIKVEL